MRVRRASLLCAGLIGLHCTQALAVERGIETYLLGSRDSLAGVLPPPGTFVNNYFVFSKGSTTSIPAGGATLVNPEFDVFSYKFNATHVFDFKVGPAQFGVNLNVPHVAAPMNVAGVSFGASGGLSGDEYAFSDIEFAPLFGWTKGILHTMLALQFFLPTGDYSLANANLKKRDINALNAGKNRFAFDQTLSMAWLNPDTGLELSGAFGATFSTKNEATDYQTAPAIHFEGTVMQHLPNKLALGLTEYAYQQWRR